MRLLYQYIAQSQKFGINYCRLVIDDLKGRVATGFDIGGKPSRWKASKVNALFKFLTTSRSVETWLQNVEESIYRMRLRKIPIKLWMVTGGYGAGKSHMKEYLRRKAIKNIRFLELKVSSLLPPSQHTLPIYDVFPLILLETKPFFEPLYDAIKKEARFLSNIEVDEELKKTMKSYSIDDDFIVAFCAYAETSSGNYNDFNTLEELIINKGEHLFLPLMKLYKKYLEIKGLCFFMDEFEGLESLDANRQMRFVQSIRAFYDKVASTRSKPELPSFQMLILCTLSYWNELTSGTRSQALETRVSLFEIPPLVEDEIIAIAEKIYVIYKKTDYPTPNFNLEFSKLPAYLVNRAGIEAPLTPRFVINEIITIIEEPNNYLEFKS